MKYENVNIIIQEKWNTYNPLFNDVHVMVFLGIGFLLTFLKNYSLTALGFNLIIGALSVQWYILGKFKRFRVSSFCTPSLKCSNKLIIWKCIDHFILLN